MPLVDEWRTVLRKAWSVRLILLAGLLSGIEVALPLLGGLLPIPQRLFAVLTLFAVGAAFVGEGCQRQTPAAEERHAPRHHMNPV